MWRCCYFGFGEALRNKIAIFLMILSVSKAFEVSSKIIILMTKNQTVDIQKGIFSLNRFKAWCYYGTVSADFNTPSGYVCIKLRSNNNFESVAPKFNRDRNCNTPGFILPTEQVNHSANLALLFQEH
jgi:hypothetical protein